MSIKQSSEKNLSTETTLVNLIDSLQFNLDCHRVNGMVTVEYKKHLIWSTIRFSLLNLKFTGWIPVPQPGSDVILTIAIAASYI